MTVDARAKKPMVLNELCCRFGLPEAYHHYHPQHMGKDKNTTVEGKLELNLA